MLHSPHHPHSPTRLCCGSKGATDNVAWARCGCWEMLLPERMARDGGPTHIADWYLHVLLRWE